VTRAHRQDDYDKAYARFYAKVSEDFRELKRLHNVPLVIVAWVLPRGAGVHCAKCVQPTAEQREKWRPVVASEGQKFVCVLCAEVSGKEASDKEVSDKEKK